MTLSAYTARIITILSLTIFLIGCATTDSKEDIGTTLGVLVGAAVGKKHGKGKSYKTQSLLTALGAGIGGAVGKGIGKHLDDKDRAKMARAAQQALASNRIQTWSNPRNKTSGSARPVRTSSTSGRPCRTIQEKIFVNGREMKQNVTACKGKNGWEVQA